MKTYHIYSDTHYGAGNFEFPNEIVIRKNTVLLGDIIEMKNIKRKLIVIEKATKELFYLKEKTIYLNGNHEVSTGFEFLPKEVIVDGILFIHGYQLIWSKKKIEKWETKNPGVNWYTLQYQRIKRSSFKKGGPKTPKDSTILKAVKLAKKFNCHTIVYGHTHNSYDGVHDGVRIVNVDRGYTCIDL